MEQDGPLEEHQFQSEEESVDDGDDGNQRLLPTQYGDNSPSKGPTKRKGGTTSAVWKVIKRLPDSKLMGIPQGTADFDTHRASKTHVCIVCWQKMKMGWDPGQGCWVSSVANNHFRKSPKCDPRTAKVLQERDNS